MAPTRRDHQQTPSTHHTSKYRPLISLDGTTTRMTGTQGASASTWQQSPDTNSASFTVTTITTVAPPAASLDQTRLQTHQSRPRPSCTVFLLHFCDSSAFSQGAALAAALAAADAAAKMGRTAAKQISSERLFLCPLQPKVQPSKTALTHQRVSTPLLLHTLPPHAFPRERARRCRLNFAWTKSCTRTP